MTRLTAKAALFIAAVMTLAVPANAQSPFGERDYELETLAENVYGIRAGTARSLAVVTTEGIIYIDPLNKDVAAFGRAALREITDQPVKYVIYSHQHWDHILGGQIFKDEGATFISHKECVKHFYRRPNPELVMPDQIVEGRTTLTLGDRSIELLYFGPNHGDCLLVPWFPDLKMPFIVDLVTPGFIGIGSMPDYNPGEWVRTLKEVERLPFENFMSAHATAIAPKSALAERRMFLEDIMAIVKRELDAGTPRQEIAAKIDLPQYSHLAGYGTSFPDFVNRLSTYFFLGW